MKKRFATVKRAKPPVSRTESELYVVAKGSGTTLPASWYAARPVRSGKFDAKFAKEAEERQEFRLSL